MSGVQGPFGGGGGQEHEHCPKVVLQEREFRRVERSNGEAGKRRGWDIDLLTSITQVDNRLPSELSYLMASGSKEGRGNKWDVGGWLGLQHWIVSELPRGALLCDVSINGGGGEERVEGDGGFEGSLDGYTALVIFQTL